MEILNSNYNQSFGAMKKTQFKGLDLFCVNTFKAPIEKFNSNMDLQNWAGKRLAEDTFTSHLTGKTERTTIERTSLYNDWKKFLDGAKYITSAASLIISASLFSKLSPKTEEVPPPVNEEVLINTLNEVENKPSFNFSKIYTENLKKNALHTTGEIPDGWIVLKSQDNDPEHFEENVEKLKLLSANSWCTKASKAEDYLRCGDFHIYYKNGKPEVGLRFFAGQVFEIAGSDNLGSVPFEYYDEIDAYIKKENLPVSERAEDALWSAKSKRNYINKAKKDLAEDIANKNYENILKYFGITMTTNENGTKTLDKYNDYYGYHNLGLDTFDMLKDVTRIEGNAEFNSSPNMNLDKLESIGGYASFSDSRVKSLKNLKEIGSWANFRGSSISDLSSLEKCEKIDLTATNVTSLPALQEIGGDLIATENIDTPKIKK